VNWLPLGVLIGGVLVAAVVAGFTAYELSWKTRRLRADLARLAGLVERLASVQTQLGEAQDRISRAGRG
jgi:hypothetical protein